MIINFERMQLRVQQALVSHSLRKLAELCDVSHEQLRRIKLDKVDKVSIDIYNKVDKGLRENGF